MSCPGAWAVVSAARISRADWSDGISASTTMAGINTGGNGLGGVKFSDEAKTQTTSISGMQISDTNPSLYAWGDGGK
jgi:hypothetical protein